MSHAHIKKHWSLIAVRLLDDALCVCVCVCACVCVCTISSDHKELV